MADKPGRTLRADRTVTPGLECLDVLGSRRNANHGDPTTYAGILTIEQSQSHVPPV